MHARYIFKSILVCQTSGRQIQLAAWPHGGYIYTTLFASHALSDDDDDFIDALQDTTHGIGSLMTDAISI
jgi:hypothetical protein